MSHWCPDHTEYEAKSTPEGSCLRCWELYFIKCPELKYDTARVLRESDGEDV